MRIATVWLENFGCIGRAEVNFDGYTALIGPNNAGKSTILSAIEKFFSSTPKIERRHFFRHEEDRVIAITIRFKELTPDESQVFGNAVIDGAMTVTRHFGGEYGLTGVYSVVARANPNFREFREELNGTNKRSIYTRLRQEYDLPAATGEVMEENLKAWEDANPERLEQVRTRGFFGAVNVANGILKRKTSVRFVPAVADVSETTSAKSSPIIELLQDIRRQTLENQKEFGEIVAEANARINQYVEQSDTRTVAEIGTTITALLQKYYADTRVEADLPPPNQIDVNFPPPTLKVIHRDISGAVDYVGHGLQRAVLFSVVQFLAQHFLTVDEKENDGQAIFAEPASDIIVMIEEPESYQHPQKQRIIRDVLQSITENFDKNTGIRIQVAVCTHSEKFIHMQNLDAIRLVSTTFVDDVYETNVRQMPLTVLRDHIHDARGGAGEPMPLSSFGATMHVFSDAISEGFFASKIVLVEGVSDVAAIEGAFVAAGVDIQADGIAVIAVDGKTKLDKPLQTFRYLGIPTFCVFDNDGKEQNGNQRKGYNQLLQRICGVENPEEMPVGVSPNGFAALEGNLEVVLRESAGNLFQECRQQVADSFGVSSSDIGKSPAAVSSFLRIAREKGCNFPVLDEIVGAVQQLSS